MEQNISLNEICDKITKLEEKNKHLEEEIEKLKKENEKLKAQQSSAGPITKGDKILFDVISEIFYVSKYRLPNEFVRHIEQFGLSEDYQKELFIKFNSKIRKIYDVKTDGDTLVGFMTKVFGNKKYCYVSFIKYRK
jgi:predicted nuclease with TOPRIM domain